jgi:hypothetical protein
MNLPIILKILIGVGAAALFWYMVGKEKTKTITIVVGGLMLAFYLLVYIGGDTITIKNRVTTDICEVNFAYKPEENGWGKDHLGGAPIRYTHTRDFRLPLYFEWLAGDSEGGYSGRVVDCEGNEVAIQGGMGIETNYEIWEILPTTPVED